MNDPATLAHYQRRLLEELRAGTEPATIVARLRADPRLREADAYLASLDFDMLRVAVELVATWARP